MLASVINTYVSLMYELKKNEKVFMSKFVGTGPSSYEKRIYRALVSQRLRNTAIYLTILYEYVLVIGCYECVHFYTDCTG